MVSRVADLAVVGEEMPAQIARIRRAERSAPRRLKNRETICPNARRVHWGDLSQVEAGVR
jgi:hypothetical protein